MTPARRAVPGVRGWWARRGFGARLLAALALVVATGTLTAAAVAAVVGPALFHDHMLRAVADGHGSAARHAEEAFASASAVQLAVALTAAVLASLAVSVPLTRRAGRSLGSLADAAREVGAGRYATPVTAAGLGTEFERLAASFTGMAQRLADADRLRARLLADVAHELRTPVATLDAYLEAVQDGVQPLDETTVRLLREQGRRLTRLAEDLAAVTRAESGDLRLERRPVPADDLAATAVRAWAERASAAGVDLAARPGRGLGPVDVDPDRIAQVLDNLVGNALRHTAPGGHVVLSTRPAGPAAVEIVVADDGVGVAAEHLPHLTERFYRVDTARDRAHGGSGIGLAISRALVEAHGGTLAVRSPGLGAGTTCTVRLPAVPSDGGHPGPRPDPHAQHLPAPDETRTP